MSRIHSLDYLKLLMAVLVAFAHTYWMQAHVTPMWFMVGNGLMRMMVPLFCIMAGYFLYRAAVRGDGVRWLMRVLALYAFWKLVYLPFWIGDVHGAVSLVKTLILGFYHLWFLAGILFAGFLLLSIRRVVHVFSHRLEIPALIAAAGLCAIVGLAMQYIHLSGGGVLGQRKFQNGLFICFPFVTIGYLLARHIAWKGMTGLPSRRMALGLTLLGMGALMVEAWLVQARWGLDVMLDIPIGSYIAAPSMFLLALMTEMPKPPIRIDPISAMIYFMHVLMIILARKLGITGLGGMMLFAVGFPTLMALALGRLGIFGPKGRSATGRDNGARSLEPYR
ncbi:acyltransferase family protein [Paracoccus sp. PAR01]|uniref:acyltransferase family protein n=1 Tax=Paracoccus sp. PAR01 TaxID=2769282 RepID=UPI0017800808|nr:acyltransferase family protein [Paracoccus sp. PAR01]MBD9525291.1 acyltransferase [Paracoccus sp. PAR01]